MRISNLAVMLAAVTALPALAQSTPVATQRQANQDARIQQGIASGQLTDKEVARLEKGQQHVADVQAKATADGVVTKRERAHIQHAQNVQSRHIAKQKHDRQHK
jgi:hypothetical protein